jgi:hypothetical protein
LAGGTTPSRSQSVPTVERVTHVARQHADDPFWDQCFPPNGWGCKCSVRQVGRAEVKSMGGPSESPKLTTVPWTNKRTGQTIQVPVGVDPGWGGNPGKTGLQVRADLRK